MIHFPNDEAVRLRQQVESRLSRNRKNKIFDETLEESIRAVVAAQDMDPIRARMAADLLLRTISFTM